jgi:hypothetical protein
MSTQPSSQSGFLRQQPNILAGKYVERSRDIWRSAWKLHGFEQQSSLSPIPVYLLHADLTSGDGS